MYYTTGDRIVALIEILSPGNKHSEHTIDHFLDKVMAVRLKGYHVLRPDLLPPGAAIPEVCMVSSGNTSLPGMSSQ
jgi:hypothetical protein